MLTSRFTAPDPKLTPTEQHSPSIGDRDYEGLRARWIIHRNTLDRDRLTVLMAPTAHSLITEMGID